MEFGIQDINEAKQRLDGLVRKTHIMPFDFASKTLSANVYLNPLQKLKLRKIIEPKLSFMGLLLMKHMNMQASKMEYLFIHIMIMM